MWGVDHLPIVEERQPAVGSVAFERGDHSAASAIRSGDGVNASFTMSIWLGWIVILPAKPIAAARLDSRAQAVEVGEVGEHGIDRRHASRRGTDQAPAAHHLEDREEPAVGSRAARRPERGREVLGAPAHAVDAVVGGDIGEVDDAGGGLGDHREVRDRGVRIGRRDHGVESVEVGDAFDLGDHQGPRAELDERLDIVATPRRVEGVDADHQLLAARARSTTSAERSHSVTLARAAGLRSGGTESSRSSTRVSAALASALARYRSLPPGTKCTDRRRGGAARSASRIGHSRNASVGSGCEALTSSTVFAAMRSPPSTRRIRCVARPAQMRSSFVACADSS